MANNIIKRTWNQNRMVRIEALTGMAFEAENGGHTFQISGVDENGDAVPLTGTVTGVFLRPDQTDVALTGTASGGVVSVTLTAECYVVPGRFALTIYTTASGQKTAVYSAVGTVANASSGTVSPAAGADVVDLVNRINTAVESIPASYTGLMAAIAPDYSNAETYSAGYYVWYNGNLYRCLSDITTAESWTAAHWKKIDLANDLETQITDLKSAFTPIKNDVIDLYGYQNEELDLSDYPAQAIYDSGGEWMVNSANYKGIIIPCDAGRGYKIKANASRSTAFSFVTALPTASGQSVSYAGSTSRFAISAGTEETETAPNGAKYLWVSTLASGNDNSPQKITVLQKDGRVDILEDEVETQNGQIDTINGQMISVIGTDDTEIVISEVPLAGIYDSGGQWMMNSASYDGKVIEINEGDRVQIKANASRSAAFSFVTALPTASGQSVSYAGSSSRIAISAGEESVYSAPTGTNYLWFSAKVNNNDNTPQSIIILGVEGELEQIRSLIGSGSRTKQLKGEWENGGIGSTGYMLPMKHETNFFRCKRTKNYIKADGFDYTAISGCILTVFEYDSNLNFIRSQTVSGNYNISDDASYFKIQALYSDTTNSVSIAIEQGGLSSTGEEEVSTTRVRTGWLDIDNLGFDSMWFKGIAYARIYDENKIILSNDGVYARYNQNKGGLCKPRSLIEVLDTEALFTVKNDAKYIRFAFSNENASEAISPQTFDIRFTLGDGAYIDDPVVYVGNYSIRKNKYVDANTMSFAYKLNLVNGVQINTDDATSSSNLLDNHQYMTSLLLLLPPNYSETGIPSKLIIWCHGSGDYSLMGNDLISNNYMDYLGYWQKEGFAIADMFVRTSKYGTMGGDINGMPTNTAAYEQGYKWLIEHFNLDDTGVYVSAKSMGGVGALAICYSNIPVKAADLLAPALNPYYQQCGYGIPSRADYINDLKLENADALLSDPSAASPMSTNDFNALMIANRDRLVGYNAYFSWVVNKTFAELVVLKFKNPGTYDDVVKVCRCPFRIHVAADDTTIAYNQSLNLIKAMKNSGSVAEIRTMPAGCASPHHAVDNDPDALKVNIVTELGYTCNNVPLAYAEAASWFKYYD